MATEQYDAAQGAHKQDVVPTVGGAITGIVRVTIDTSKPKRDALLALEAIISVIIQGKWPPV